MARQRSWFRWQVLLPLAAAASSATVPAAFAADSGGLPYRNPRAEAAAGGGVIESRGWIAQRQDAETGVTYLHARYYDPALGLFVSPDTPNPIEPGVGINRYAYSMGDPINASDRSGNANCVLHQYETVVIDGSYRHSYWDVITVCVRDGGGVSIDRIQNTPRRRRRSSALDATTAAPEIIAAYVSGVGDPVLPPAPAPPIVAPDPAPPALPGPVAPICDKFPQFPGCTGSIDPRPNPCAEAPGLPGCGTPGAPPRPPVVPICAKFPTLPGCDEAWSERRAGPGVSRAEPAGFRRSVRRWRRIHPRRRAVGHGDPRAEDAARHVEERGLLTDGHSRAAERAAGASCRAGRCHPRALASPCRASASCARSARVPEAQHVTIQHHDANAGLPCTTVPR